jgi:hypothetical protein
MGPKDCVFFYKRCIFNTNFNEILTMVSGSVRGVREMLKRVQHDNPLTVIPGLTRDLLVVRTEVLRQVQHDSRGDAIPPTL